MVISVPPPVPPLLGYTSMILGVSSITYSNEAVSVTAPDVTSTSQVVSRSKTTENGK